MESGVPRPKGPTCTKCRNHGIPNVPLKKHRSVCPYKDHGMECDKGCALIVARQKVNEEIERALKRNGSMKRSHSENDKKVDKKKEPDDVSSFAEGNNSKEAVEAVKTKKARALPSETCQPFDSSQQLVPIQPHSVHLMPQPSVPYCCLHPYQSALLPYMRPQGPYRYPGVPWSYVEPGQLPGWGQYQDVPCQVPVHGSALYQSTPSYSIPDLNEH